MLRYYLNRELSARLNIPINRWKRWTREFLPPDPLGGLQSGYARQLSIREAFAVYLGGFLVSVMGFSIPQARQVLKDLNTWLKRHIVDIRLIGPPVAGGDRGTAGSHYEIHIRKPAPGNGAGKLTYRIRTCHERTVGESGDSAYWVETYTETVLKTDPADTPRGYPPACFLLEITTLADRFAGLMQR